MNRVHSGPEGASIPVAADGEGSCPVLAGEASMTVWIVNDPVHGKAIRQWSSEGLEGGTHVLVPLCLAEREVQKWMQRAVDAEEMLRDIGDKAHDASTGPEVPDLLWEIRADAYAILTGEYTSTCGTKRSEVNNTLSNHSKQ